MATIILTGGGTAGHCTPHLAILPYLRESFDKIYYIGSKNGIERNIIQKQNIPYCPISCVKFERKKILKNTLIPIKLAKGIKEAEKILNDIKPDVVFSKGGYVSLPVVFACKKKKIPIITHESDFSLGLANKVSAKFCEKVLTTFPETATKLKNGQYVGAPIRILTDNLSVKEKLNLFGINGNKPILLVTGGSQGSTCINSSVRKSLNHLLPIFDVLHVCGKNNIDSSINKEGYYQIEFTDKLGYAMDICSICISRAGSNTIFELLNKKIPCLLIPIPKGTSRGDQILNARYFQKKGMVSVLEQDCLTENSLLNEVNALYSNRHNIKRNIEDNPIKIANKDIADILIKYSAT